MLGPVRYIVSRLMTEQFKFWLTIKLSHSSYFFLKALKGIAPVWDDDQEFLKAYEKITGRILLDKARAYLLYQIAQQQQNVEGDYLELGSYRCGGAYLLSIGDKLQDKKIVIIDSFDGLPEVTDEDPYWEKGDMGGIDFEEIQSFLSSNFKNTKYEIKRGFFPQDVNLDDLEQGWSMIHVDTDLYQPTIDALDFFFPRMSLGGAIVIDDYGNMSCPGVRQAVTEFCDRTKAVAIFSITGQAVIYKNANFE